MCDIPYCDRCDSWHINGEWTRDYFTYRTPTEREDTMPTYDMDFYEEADQYVEPELADWERDLIIVPTRPANDALNARINAMIDDLVAAQPTRARPTASVRTSEPEPRLTGAALEERIKGWHWDASNMANVATLHMDDDEWNKTAAIADAMSWLGLPLEIEGRSAIHFYTRISLYETLRNTLRWGMPKLTPADIHARIGLRYTREPERGDERFERWANWLMVGAQQNARRRYANETEGLG